MEKKVEVWGFCNMVITVFCFALLLFKFPAPQIEKEPDYKIELLKNSALITTDGKTHEVELDSIQSFIEKDNL